jgi:hypothetical protein
MKDWTIKLLLSFQSKGFRNLYRPMRFAYFLTSIEEKRTLMGDAALGLLQPPYRLNDDELKFLGACLRILMPRSDKFWINFDHIIHHMNEQRLMSPEISLFYHHILCCSLCDNSFDHITFRTPSFLLNRLDEYINHLHRVSTQPHQPIFTDMKASDNVETYFKKKYPNIELIGGELGTIPKNEYNKIWYENFKDVKLTAIKFGYGLSKF